MRTLRMYFLLYGAALRGQTQYRGNFLMMMLAGLAYQGVGLAFIWVLIGRFGGIAGWSLGQVAFLYGIRLTAHGLVTVPCAQIFTVDQILREGDFDRYLVRPVNPLVQLLTRSISLQVFGDLLGGLIALGAAISTVRIDWSPGALAFLVLAIVGGALVELAIVLAFASLSFRLLSVRSLILLGLTTMQNFGNYPIVVFPAAMRFVFTFLFPLAFIAYLPSTVLLHRTSELSVSPVLAWGAPLIGVLLFTAAYRLWVRQSRHYVSSGH